jgi:hypothetical protein
VPELDAVPDQDGHFVACLLEPATRRQLWAELQEGKLPEVARERVGLKDSA